MKLYSGCKSIILATFTIFYLNSGSFIVGIDEPGNTPCNKVESSGISSAISFGTRVSQTDLKRIFCSKSYKSFPFIEET